MRTALSGTLALLLAANGLAMLLVPQLWYQSIPSVPPTGPFNAHFVRDIGCAYLVSGWAMAWLALDPRRGAAAALAVAVFQLAHAFLHIWDLLAGRSELAYFLLDVILVILPALLMVALAWPQVRAAR